MKLCIKYELKSDYIYNYAREQIAVDETDFMRNILNNFIFDL